MFHATRLKLTAWYLVIIMFISIMFSLVIFVGVNTDFERIEHFQRARQQRLEEGLRQFPVHPDLPAYDPLVVSSARDRLILTLLLVNLGILVLAGGAGYFLAGRTLTPIRLMLDEQERFVADASHELRTPITSLRTALEVNIRDKNLTLERAKVLLASNLEEVASLQALSDDLIKLAQYESANGNVVFSPVSLKEVVYGAVKSLDSLSTEKKIIIKTRVENVEILADKRGIHELLIILLENAIKYSPEKATVTIVSKQIDGDVLLSVSDVGMGIDPEDIPHVFERFYRGEKSRSKAQADGYGLGLSIAKKIVETHHGEISVKSQLSKGTTFSVKLPIKV